MMFTNPQIKRPSWDEFFMLAAILAASRASCWVRGVGVAVVDPESKRIIATGYNGAPPETKNCLELGTCEYRQKAWDDAKGDVDLYKSLSVAYKSLCPAVHAETNALSQLAQFGGSSKGKVLYITNFPCADCARDEILSKGIAKVVYWLDYDPTNTIIDPDTINELTMGKLLGAGVNVEQLSLTDERLKELLFLQMLVGRKTDYEFAPIRAVGC